MPVKFKNYVLQIINLVNLQTIINLLSQIYIMHLNFKMEYSFYYRMNKRNSHKKLNGQIFMMQAELMSKLAQVNQPKRDIDQLGFNRYQTSYQTDALVNLISKSKNITKNHAKEIENAKKNHLRQVNKRKNETQGTFLTGLGMVKDNQTDSKSKKQIPLFQNYLSKQQQSDPDTMLKQLIVKNSVDDLEELRRMIRETGANLEGCSKKLNKSKKSIMHIADRYSNEVPSLTLNFLTNYREFDAKKLQQINNYH